ncbi:MAG TPA: YggT family protein [Bacillota bacterium]|jgi:YggT family protein|nr:YggT family protein [Bacillota bacterium]
MTILIIQTVNTFFQIVIYLILGRAIMSWFIRPGDRLYSLYLGVVRLTEPILSPFRSLTRRVMGNSSIDFSPMLAIFAVYFLQRMLIKLFMLTII